MKCRYAKWIFGALVAGAIAFVYLAHYFERPLGAAGAGVDRASEHFALLPPPIDSGALDSSTPLSPAYFTIPNPEKSAHASAIVALDRFYKKAKNPNENPAQNPNHAPSQNLNQNFRHGSGVFMALFFAGSREGANDVGIYQSFFLPNASHAESAPSTLNSPPPYENLAKSTPIANTLSWTPPRKILSPEQLSTLSGKFIAKLGNPISFVDEQGRVHVFVVGVSLGGWATSRIYQLLFDERLEQLKFVRELALSPFANLSYLVRAPAMNLEGGGFVLPIYHELARKYPLLLHFNANLELESKTLPLPFTQILGSKAHSKLQPSFVALSPTQSLGVYRNYVPSPMLVSLCDGISPMYCTTKPSNLTNNGSSSVLFSISEQVFLLHNEEGREQLWIYVLKDSSTLDSSKAIESNHEVEKREVVEFLPLLLLDSVESSEVSYPSIAQSDEYIHIAYTYKRAHIKSALLSRAKLYGMAKAAQELAK